MELKRLFSCLSVDMWLGYCFYSETMATNTHDMFCRWVTCSFSGDKPFKYLQVTNMSLLAAYTMPSWVENLSSRLTGFQFLAALVNIDKVNKQPEKFSFLDCSVSFSSSFFLFLVFFFSFYRSSLSLNVSVPWDMLFRRWGRHRQPWGPKRLFKPTLFSHPP